MLHIKKGGTGLLLEVMGIFIALTVVLISQLYAIVLELFTLIYDGGMSEIVCEPDTVRCQC